MDFVENFRTFRQSCYSTVTNPLSDASNFFFLLILIDIRVSNKVFEEKEDVILIKMEVYSLSDVSNNFFSISISQDTDKLEDWCLRQFF